ncbi:MAG: DUF4384 domain-containing protein [Kosmotogaceae bacterium]
MRRLIILSVLVLTFSLYAFSVTGVSYNPRDILLKPTDKTINVTVNTDKSMPGSYYTGDTLNLSFVVSDDSYVAVLDIMPNGRVDVLFPNKYDQNNFMKGGKTYSLPTDRASTNYNLKISSDRGREIILVIASDEPLPFLDSVTSQFGSTAFPYLINNVKNLKGVVQNSMTNQNWNFGFTYFFANYNPMTGSLQINADRDATVYVDGLPRGSNPLTLDLEVGNHWIYLENDKDLVYGPDTLHVSSGYTTKNFTLKPNYPYGYIKVTCEPNASVYVDGEMVGTTPYKDFARVGQHRVEVSKWEYHSASMNVTVKEGETQTASFILQHKTKEEVKRDTNVLIMIIGGVVLLIGLLVVLTMLN